MSNSIMVCDDEPGFRDLVKNTLERGNHNITTVHNGEEALSIFQNKKPDLLLLDVKMPELDGWEVLREMRKRSTIDEVPVVMLTGEELSLVKVMRKDINYLVDYLEKPFNPFELLVAVNNILKKVKEIFRQKEKIIKKFSDDGKPIAEAFVSWSRMQMIHKRLLEKLKQIKSRCYSSEKRSRIEKLIEGEKQTIQQTAIKKEEILELAGITHDEN